MATQACEQQAGAVYSGVADFFVLGLGLKLRAFGLLESFLIRGNRHVERHGINDSKFLGLHVVFSGLEVNGCHMAVCRYMFCLTVTIPWKPDPQERTFFV